MPRITAMTIVILDTAGRLHIDEALMEELQDDQSGRLPPTEILLVVDAMTGQDAVNVAKSFDEALGIDGVILTKLDGDTRGGAALSVRAVTGKPIKFAGIGEKLEDLEAVSPGPDGLPDSGHGRCADPDREGPEPARRKEGGRNGQRSKEESSFDLNDLLDQMQQIKKMGPLQQVHVDAARSAKGRSRMMDADNGRCGSIEKWRRSLPL